MAFHHLDHLNSFPSVKFSILQSPSSWEGKRGFSCWPLGPLAGFSPVAPLYRSHHHHLGTVLLDASVPVCPGKSCSLSCFLLILQTSSEKRPPFGQVRYFLLCAPRVHCICREDEATLGLLSQRLSPMVSLLQSLHQGADLDTQLLFSKCGGVMCTHPGDRWLQRPGAPCFDPDDVLTYLLPPSFYFEKNFKLTEELQKEYREPSNTLGQESQVVSILPHLFIFSLNQLSSLQSSRHFPP